ncbi:Amino acid permease [Micromonospora mirobrigensis]|uniref:Amino acid permease n=1 Tax=Micromonospora mirobrigensis TaxID=262898 RepID=A0A1C5AKY8_9ACTN|nr:Amino acid permease [Micromonospora mirobrigensis]
MVAFLVLALAALTGLLPDAPAAVDVAAQELAPGGWLAVLTGLLVVLFSYAGTEVVAIAAAESEDPANTLRRATRSVVGRILLFYIGSVVAIVLLLPTAETPTTTSPFSAVLDRLGVPSAATIMDVVIVVALCSAMNSALYVCSRMLYGLAQAGDATPRLMRVNRRGVPQAGLLISAAAAAVALAIAVASPDTAFLVLLGAASAVLIPLYLLLACAELRIRRQAERTEPERLTIRMWFFPYGTYLLIAVMVAITIAMILLPDFLPQVVLTGVAFLVILGAYTLRRRRAERSGQLGTLVGRQER